MNHSNYYTHTRAVFSIVFFLYHHFVEMWSNLIKYHLYLTILLEIQISNRRISLIQKLNNFFGFYSNRVLNGGSGFSTGKWNRLQLRERNLDSSQICLNIVYLYEVRWLILGQSIARRSMRRNIFEAHKIIEKKHIDNTKDDCQ